MGEIDVGRYSHLHQNWQDEQGNTCNWVIRAWRAVKVTAITNGFRKAGITRVPGATEGDTSDASEISDDEQSVATLDPALDAQLIDPCFNGEIRKNTLLRFENDFTSLPQSRLTTQNLTAKGKKVVPPHELKLFLFISSMILDWEARWPHG